jgi:hypothetical protein
MMNRFKYKYSFAALALVALVYLSLSPVIVFAVRLPRKNFKLINTVKVTTNTKIRLNYLHSVEHTQVEGRFYVGADDRLHILETRMASVGTGLPNDVPERSHIGKNWMVVDENRKVIDNLNFYVVPINHTHLYVGNQEIPLNHLQSGTLIHLEVEHTQFYRWILWRLVNLDWRKENEKNGN